jgi:D-ribose pyranase
MVASTGHTDYIVLADKGYPVPHGVNRINLGFLDDMPTVVEVLKAISLEMTIDRIIVTNEMYDISSERLQELRDLFPNISFEQVSHIELKELTKTANGVVKTGDTCAYANLIVISG